MNPSTKKSLVIFVLISLIIATYKGCGGQFNQKWKDKRELQELTKRGNRLIEALDKYQQKNEEYPENLEELLPVYLSSIPIPNPKVYRSEIHYIKTPNNHKFKEPYQLIVFAKQLEVLGDRCWKWVIYLPSKKYESTQYTTVHKVINGWSAETKCREYTHPRS